MKALRAVALALIAALAIGLAVGTWLRLQLEQPTIYLAD
jgi:hypothetical protein